MEWVRVSDEQQQTEWMESVSCVYPNSAENSETM